MSLVFCFVFVFLLLRRLVTRRPNYEEKQATVASGFPVDARLPLPYYTARFYEPAAMNYDCRFVRRVYSLTTTTSSTPPLIDTRPARTGENMASSDLAVNVCSFPSLSLFFLFFIYLSEIK